MKVSLFVTCICDMFTPKVGQHTVEILEKVGCKVDFPEAQICCGQPAYNSGYVKESKRAMQQLIRAFEKSEYVVGPSGSCIGMLKQYPDIFKGDPKWEEEAIALANKSYEISEFLVDVLKVIDVGSNFKGRVTYHRSCHMSRILGVKDAPIKLLKNIAGVELVELPQAEDCCGFGGTFSVKYDSISAEMVKAKTKHIASTKVDYLIGSDLACLMNIGGRLRREGQEIEVLHITEVLNASS